MGRSAHVVEQLGQQLLAVESLVFAIEVPDENASFVVGEAREIGAAVRMPRILQYAAGVLRRTIDEVVDHVAHDAYEREIDRFAERFAYGRGPAAVLPLEV